METTVLPRNALVLIDQVGGRGLWGLGAFIRCYETVSAVAPVSRGQA